jgi:hypothetical protein
VSYGSITKPGPRIVFVESELRDSSDKLIDTASSCLLLVPR